jgi:hypothetical protein
VALELRVQTAERDVPVEIIDPFVVICGFTGRDDEAVAAHVRELDEIGVAAPTTVPMFIPLPGHLLLSAGARVEVISAETSGEAEAVLVRMPDGRELLTVGSDHTDRRLERISIQAGKIACPKVLSKTAWEFAEIAGRWDDLVLTSTSNDASPHHEARLASIRPASELMEAMLDAVDVPGERPLVVFLGTVPGSAGAASGDGSFAARLADLARTRTVECSYAFEDLSTRPREVAE